MQRATWHSGCCRSANSIIQRFGPIEEHLHFETIDKHPFYMLLSQNRGFLYSVFHHPIIWFIWGHHESHWSIQIVTDSRYPLTVQISDCFTSSQWGFINLHIQFQTWHALIHCLAQSMTHHFVYMWTALWHPMDVVSSPPLRNNPQPNPVPKTLTLWEIHPLFIQDSNCWWFQMLFLFNPKI